MLARPPRTLGGACPAEIRGEIGTKPRQNAKDIAAEYAEMQNQMKIQKRNARKQAGTRAAHMPINDSRSYEVSA